MKHYMSPKSLSFPIVGIGASAGGLEAFEQFFKSMPPDIGISFVLIQHLDPNRQTELPNILQNYTEMKVLQVDKRVEVKPNFVYIIPPNCNLAIFNQVLEPIKYHKPIGLRLPIDYFSRVGQIQWNAKQCYFNWISR